MPQHEWRHPVTATERGEIIREVVTRTMTRLASPEADAPDALEDIISDVLYHEKQRLKSARSEEEKKESEFLARVTRGLAAAVNDEKRLMLEKLVEHYAEDVAGHFDPKVFTFTTKILPYGLEAIFNAFTPAMLFRTFPNVPDLQARIVVRGDIDFLKKLARRATLVFTPTHSSNLDSLMVGWALNETGLPPVNYGAAKTLFTNPLISFFINSLGAYKVDRRIRHSLYKEVLKTYSLSLLESGRHCLFFPGGTRSRSGAVETKLKLGLLGTTVTAFTNSLIAKKENPDIYIVPLTINYPLVLEAETLVEDYLQEVGKSRYIITDDEFSKPRTIMRLVTSLMAMDSSMAMQFGRPLDIFGNDIDDEGRSVDSRGRVIDPRRYVVRADGRYGHDAERDAEYTRELGVALTQSFRRNTVVLSTHVLAFALFRMLKAAHSGVDLYRLLRFEGDGAAISVRDALGAIEKTTTRLLELQAAGRISLGGSIRPGECAREIMYEALRFFSMYHTRPVVVRKRDNLLANDPNLLFFYHNRLTGWGLEALFDGGKL